MSQNVVIYCRGSRKEQQLTLGFQRKVCQAYAEFCGLTVVRVVEENLSAKDTNRPGFQEALQMLRDGTASGIVIYRLDRLCRSLKDLAELIEEFFDPHAKYPSALHSTSEKVDTSSPGGQLILNVLMSVAQWELATTRLRTRNAMCEKRERGEKTGGHCPYGFSVEWDGNPDHPKRLVTNEQEKVVLDYIARRREAGASLRGIAAELTRAGHPTRSGKPWDHGTVAKLCKRASAVSV